MRIPSGVTDQYVYFVAVDATDFTTRETGLSSFSVYRSRNGGAAAAMTTPTVNETSSANMPGVYELLLDEDMTIDSGDDEQEMAFHITHAGMAPVTRAITLFRPKITVGQTVTASGGAANSVVQSVAANAITATAIASNAITSAKIAASAIGASQIAADAITAAKIAANAIGSSELAVDAVTEIQSGLATAAALAALNNLSVAQVNTEVDTALAEYDAPTKAELDAGLAALNDLSAAEVNAQVDAAFTTQMADSVAADGAIPTREQALLMVSRFLFERSVASTTVTVTKEDGSTSSMTFALDDANNPTSITRSA